MQRKIACGVVDSMSITRNSDLVVRLQCGKRMRRVELGGRELRSVTEPYTSRRIFRFDRREVKFLLQFQKGRKYPERGNKMAHLDALDYSATGPADQRDPNQCP
jgi:hypothetical protein